MLSINGKKFMTLPEAVQWLLDNNALPFQCKANYVADTIVAKTEIINPSPAEIKVGSLVLFADSKVGTVSGITDSGFMVGQEYTDIGSRLNQITDINLDASDHLIFTLGNGDTIDAGLVKELSGLSINASQHLIANYNDGTSTDLGAIFQGNVNISGNFTADSIIENMSGYSAVITPNSDYDFENVYTGAVKNGNKLTLVAAINITRLQNVTSSVAYVEFVVPTEVYNKLYYTLIGGYNILNFPFVKAIGEDASAIDLGILIMKSGSNVIRIALHTATIPNLVLNKKYYVRLEATFLLSNGLI